jgi:hypothetical protein
MSTDFQSEYDSLVQAMKAEQFAQANQLATNLLRDLAPPQGELEEAFFAGASYMRANSLSKIGEVEEAMEAFADTSAKFGYHADPRLQYWAAAADIGHATLLHDAGRFQEAHHLLDLATLRTMMVDHPPVRQLWGEMMRMQRHLEDKYGFKNGDGLDAAAKQGAEAPVSETSLAPAAPPEEEEYIYEKVESLFEKTPRQWRVTPSAVTVRQGGRDHEVPYSQLKTLQFRYAPTRLKMNRYAAQLKLKSGASHLIDNLSFVGVGQFKSNNLNFVVTMVALTLQIEKSGEKVAIRGGVSWLYYLFMIALMAVLVPFIILIGFAAGYIGILLLIVGLIGLTGILIKWFRYNWPRTITSDTLSRYLPSILD